MSKVKLLKKQKQSTRQPNPESRLVACPVTGKMVDPVIAERNSIITIVAILCVVVVGVFVLFTRLSNSWNEVKQQGAVERVQQKKDHDAMINNPDYKAGYEDGYLVGKTDAANGRKRDGQKAMRLGEIHSDSRNSPRDYKYGYTLGYNTGWADRNKLNEKEESR